MKGYKEITQEILDKLREGVVPWRQNWVSGIPSNAVSKKPYRGINTWLLHNHTYESSQWMTYKQCKELGGYIRKGEHGRAIVFWKILEVAEDDTDKVDTIPLLRTYTVFNVQQTSILMESPTVEFNPIAEAQRVVDNYRDKPPIELGEPSYIPSRDVIGMPAPTSFDSADHYYCTLYHELSHSTAHSSRLSRPIRNSYGSDQYAEEELIAEMGAAYLAGTSGTQVYGKNITNIAAYIRHWSERFSENDRLIVRLSSQGQRAADYILGGQSNSQDATSDDSSKMMQCCNCGKSQYVQSESSWYCIEKEQFTNGSYSPENPTR